MFRSKDTAFAPNPADLRKALRKPRFTLCERGIKREEAAPEITLFKGLGLSGFQPYLLLNIQNDFPQRDTKRFRNSTQGDKRRRIDAKFNGSEPGAAHVTAL